MTCRQVRRRCNNDDNNLTINIAIRLDVNCEWSSLRLSAVAWYYYYVVELLRTTQLIARLPGGSTYYYI